MRIRGPLAAALAIGMAVGTASIATAHAPGVADGHVPANTNYGISPVGYSPLAGVQDGRYTDVWAHEGYAYVGSFQNPDCSNDGVYIADISDPANPDYQGQIHSPPGTRVNDVKVTTVGRRDVLVMSHETCGSDVAASAASQVGRDRAEVIDDAGLVGQGYDGISLYDVTRPNAPRALVKGFLETEVHNTFPWTTEDGRTFLLVVDNFNVNDTWVVEITDPRKPQLLTTTGLADWLASGDVAPGDQLAFGTFPFPLLHDVWVEYNENEGRWEAVLSYWDLGFVTLDLTDPANPVFLNDSDYPAQDPVLAEERAALFGGAPEGNAHAAVFGGTAETPLIFGGDEDFDASAVTLTTSAGTVGANGGSDTPAPPQSGIAGDLTFVGLACGESIQPAASATDIALIERGACAFTTKAGEITAAGYAAGVVFNRSGPDVICDSGISMLVAGSVPMVSITRTQGMAIMGLTCEDDDETSLSGGDLVGDGFGEASLASSFVGWGYFWALTNDTAGATVPGTLGSADGETTVGHLGTVGYYAPAELKDPALASGAGDLSMHNLETDLEDRNRTFVSWYSLGMRVLEYRPGHFHDDSNGEGSYSWNIHETGRWIAGDENDPTSLTELAPFAAQHGLDVADLTGSNFWGVTQAEIDGTRYILGSDRNTGLWIFEYECTEDPDGAGGPLYCGATNGG